MVLSPCQHAVQNGTQFLPPGGQPVVHVRRDVIGNGTNNDAIAFEAAQLLGKHFLGDAAYPPFEIRKALDLTIEEMKQDH